MNSKRVRISTLAIRGFLSYDRNPETKALPQAARDRLGKMADLAALSLQNHG
jgi:hypothetical protein